jgi:hypothetical protein
MKRATSLLEIPNSFQSEPLKIEQLAEFYQDTIEVRTGTRANSPLDDIYDSCIEPKTRNAHLLIGHRGCGKSTELNHLAERLSEIGYHVKIISCMTELDGSNMAFSDILVLMTDALLSLANEYHVSIKKADLLTLDRFGDEIKEEDIVLSETETEIGSGASLETPKLLSNLIHFFISLKSSLKLNQSSRTTIRKTITIRNKEWLDAVNRIGDAVTEAFDGRQPILCFEDLDKGNTWDIFAGHCEILTGTTFPVIYTFPIAYSYRQEYAEIKSYFQISRLPMIEVKKMDGSRNEHGISVIRDIIASRSDLQLFEKDVADYLIVKTGGSLRHLFLAIRQSSTYARRQKQSTIGMDVVSIALEQIKGDISSQLQGNDHAFLKTIYEGKHQYIEDRDRLLSLMNIGAVLEYNGKRWHDVHPLIVDYLKEVGVIA